MAEPWAGMCGTVGAESGVFGATLACDVRFGWGRGGGLEGVYEVPMADVERLLQGAITVTDEFHVGLEDICGA